MTYATRVPAFEHQREALGAMAQRRAFGLLMYMRTGKTKVALDDFGRLELAGQVTDMLVIAPHGAYHTWEPAINEHVSVDLRARLALFTWDSGKAHGAKTKALAAEFLALRGKPRVLIINIEALSVVKAAQVFCLKFLRDRTKAMIVIDESTSIRNHRAKRTKFILRALAPQAEWKRILTGLPDPKSPMDYYAQFEFLDPRILGFTNWWTFRTRYAIVEQRYFGGRKVDQITGFRNLEELRRKIAPHVFRVPFRPKIPSTYSIREVELTDEQKRIYAEMKRYCTAQLTATAHVTATVVIAQIIRMHQILLGYTMDDHHNMHEIPEHRTAALLELLEDYSGKAVIWCCYDYNVRKIAEVLTKEYGPGSVARFWGGNASTREAEQAQFKADPACRFIVGTPAAGRFGRDWNEADLVIYYSSSSDLEHRDQSEMRVQGMLKSRQVDYVDLIVPNTVESKILYALRKKIDLASTLNGDAWRQWVI